MNLVALQHFLSDYRRARSANMTRKSRSVAKRLVIGEMGLSHKRGNDAGIRLVIKMITLRITLASFTTAFVS
jgi:hypothetical protein